MKKRWHEKPGAIYWYDQYALNEAATAFAKYDPDRIVKELLGVDADIYAIYAANQFNLAYYPSEVVPQHPGLLGRDYVGDIVPRLRSKGKRVVLYLNWLDSKHPEWNAVPLQSDGKPRPPEPDYPLVSWADPGRDEWRVRRVPGGKWQLPCFNSPKSELILKMTDELAARYEFDGFHLDMYFHYGLCVCDRCQPHLRRILGADAITWQRLADHWTDYMRWKQGVCARYIHELGARAKARNPEMVFLPNTGWHEMPAMLGISEQWLPAVDLYLSECSFGRDLLMASLITKHHKAVRKPTWMLVTSTPHGACSMGHSPISRNKAMICAAGTKANGGEVFGFCGVGARQDTTSDRRLLGLARDTLAWWKGKKGDVNPALLSSAARAAVVFSWNTNAFYAPPIPGRPAPSAALELRGWSKRLIEDHIPFNMEIAEDAADGRLFPYDLLILPNVACTDKPFEDAVRRFVEQGGTLVATGETSLCDTDGRRKPDFGLADVLGVSYVSGYPSRRFYLEHPEEPIVCNGHAQCVRAVGTVLARLVAADPAGCPNGGNDPIPMETTEWPLLVQHNYGKGRVYYLGWNPGEFYETANYWQTAAWMSGVLEAAHGARFFRTNAPATVEVMSWKAGPHQRVLALVNGTTPNLDANGVAPLSDIEIEIPVAAGRVVKATSPETPVTLKRRKGVTVVTLRRLDVYASVTLELASGKSE